MPGALSKGFKRRVVASSAGVRCPEANAATITRFLPVLFNRFSAHIISPSSVHFFDAFPLCERRAALCNKARQSLWRRSLHLHSTVCLRYGYLGA